MKKASLKKLMALILALAYISMFTACGNNTATSEPPAESTAATDAATQTDSNGPPEEESEAPAFDGQIIIGMCCDITGPNSLAGTASVNAAKLSVKQINEMGGILGKEVVLEIVDDQSQADMAINAVQKLVSNPDVVAIAGSLLLTGMVLAVEDIVEQYGVPTIVGGSSPSIVETGNPYIFRIRVNDNLTNQITFEYFRDETDLKIWGEFYANTDFGGMRNGNFNSFCEDNDIEHYSVNGNVGDKDWTAQIMELKKNGCELIFLDVDVTEQNVIVQQMYDLGYVAQFAGGNMLGTTEFLDVAPQEVSEGTIFVGETALDSPIEGFQEWRELYKAEYGEEPHTSAIAMQPAIWLLKDAIERAGSTDREAIRDALADTVGFQGITGPLTYNKETGVDMNTTILFSRIENREGVCFLAYTAEKD